MSLFLKGEKIFLSGASRRSGLCSAVSVVSAVSVNPIAAEVDVHAQKLTEVHDSACVTEFCARFCVGGFEKGM